MKKRSSGFTLVELLVVIAIIAILGVIGTTLFSNITRNAQDSKRRSDVDAIAKAYEVNYQNGLYVPLADTNFQGGIPRDPDPGREQYFNWLDSHGGGFKVCASLSANSQTVCNDTAADCYCKTSVLGTVDPGSTIAHVSGFNGGLPFHGPAPTSAPAATPTPVSTSTGLLPGGNFIAVGTHPDAKNQSTNIGKALLSMIAWRGKLYTGYGDYYVNTGPIQIRPFDSVSKTFDASVLAANTEAIYNYRIVGNNLYAAAIDPRYTTYNYAYVKGEPWVNAVSTGIDGEHIFDVVTLTGSDLYAVGSRITGRDSAVWKSTDGGGNWILSLSENPLTSDGYARYYFAGVYKNNLYVQAHDTNGTRHPNSKIYNGTVWSDGPSLFPADALNGSAGWRPIVFAGKMLFKNYAKPTHIGKLIVFDGTQPSWVNTVDTWTFDLVEESSYLYTLGCTICTGDLTIRRSMDLVSWETVAASVPDIARSIVFLNGKLYMGGSDSKIYEYREP